MFKKAYAMVFKNAHEGLCYDFLYRLKENGLGDGIHEKNSPYNRIGQGPGLKEALPSDKGIKFREDLRSDVGQFPGTHISGAVV